MSRLTLCLIALALTVPIRAATPPSTAPTPVPHVSFEGPALSFDFPGVEIGVAEYEEGPTGTTVLYFPKSVEGVVDTRGGAPGTIDTDALRLGYESSIDAIVLSGGSSYGLSAATGVANAVKEAITDPGNWRNIPGVSGAIVFDLGDRRFNAITPDDALGRAAWQSRRAGWVPLGARGAGRFVETGYYFGTPQHSGQGAAFRQVGDLKVLVVTVVNATGLVVDRSGHAVRCAQPSGERCASIAEMFSAHLAAQSHATSSPQARADAGKSGRLTAHTTITAVIVNEALPVWALQRIAIQVHSSMGRAIQPFSTLGDGDTLFAVTTGAVRHQPLPDEEINELGVLASETAWDAILASVPVLPPPTPRRNITVPPRLLDGMVGRYVFAKDAIAELRRRADTLEIELNGQTSDYLVPGRPLLLTAVATDEFEIAGPRGDRLHIDRDSNGAVIGITINPGLWPLHARRLTHKG
jgi:L-aminopeptidase/D-esterase-like protein